MSHSLLWMACQAWVAVPAISLERGLSYPRHGLVLFFEFLAAYLGTLLIVSGIYLAVPPHLPRVVATLLEHPGLDPNTR